MLADGCGCSPLHRAAIKGYSEVIQELLENGAEVNIVNQKGHTPLYLSTDNSHLATAKLLVAAGADVQ